METLVHALMYTHIQSDVPPLVSKSPYSDVNTLRLQAAVLFIAVRIVRYVINF